MKVGAEPKKVWALGGLALVAGYLLYTNVFSTPGPPSPVRAPTPSVVETEAGLPVRRAEPMPSPRMGLQEFRPSLRTRRTGQLPDIASIDATLRLDLLAKLHEVTVEGGERSLFEFAPAPLPKKPEPKIIPKELVAAKEAEEKKPPEVARKPPPPPIPLKFYGYTAQFREGNRRAFFLDGEEIFVASEGDVLKKRYKILRIGVNSVVVEDLEHQYEQTLRLEEQAG